MQKPYYIKQVFKEDQIPFPNSIFNFCDSKNYMRGKIPGFETQLRDYMPHLLDINGETCYHMHVTGMFLLPFQKHMGQSIQEWTK